MYAAKRITGILTISLFIISCGLLSSCASVSTEQSAAAKEGAAMKDTPYPAYTGEKSRVQILRFGVPKEVTDQYPELAEKRIGWGLYNTVIDELADSKRFEFIEEKDAIRNKIMQNWALSQSGIVAEEQQIDMASGLALPQYLVYAEVFDFSVSTKETLVGVAAKTVNTTRVGIQLRLVNVSNAKYVPKSGTGEATTTATTVWVMADQPFDQSTVGMATKRAVHAAVIGLLQEMP